MPGAVGQVLGVDDASLQRAISAAEGHFHGEVSAGAEGVAKVQAHARTGDIANRGAPDERTVAFHLAGGCLDADGMAFISTPIELDTRAEA